MELEEKVGIVVQRRFGEGTKSDHDAVCLDCGDALFILRRPGGNPFNDPAISELVGKRICARGYTIDYTFVLNDWKEA